MALFAASMLILSAMNAVRCFALFPPACWADVDGDGNHPGCCHRNVPALRVGKSVPGLFQNARVHLSAVRKGRSASGLVCLAAVPRGTRPTEVQRGDFRPLG